MSSVIDAAFKNVNEEEENTMKNKENELNAKLGRSISILLYSDVVSKGGLKISYRTYNKKENLIALLTNNSINNKNNETVSKIQVIEKGFLRIIVTDRTDIAKYRYCVRIMNSKFSKTHKRMFVNNLNEIKDIEVRAKLFDERKNIYDSVEAENPDGRKMPGFGTYVKNVTLSIGVGIKKAIESVPGFVKTVADKICIKLAVDFCVSKITGLFKKSAK